MSLFRHENHIDFKHKNHMIIILCKSIVIQSSEEIFETSGFTCNGTCILSEKSGYQSFESFEI